MANLLVPPLAGDPSSQILDAMADERITQMNLQPLLVYDMDNVNASALTHLAEQFSLLDEPAWAFAVTDDDKRALIKSAIEIHRYKGTPWAVKQACALMGFGVVVLIEGIGKWYADGSVKADGSHYCGGEDLWPYYIIIVYQPVSNVAGLRLQIALLNIAPARCFLTQIDFTASGFLCDGSVSADGSFNCGLIEFSL